MTATPNLALKYIVAGQANAEINHNEALNIVDILLNRGVIDRDHTAPPAHADGNAYIVAASATGAWLGKDGQIAASFDGGWVFYTPMPGWSVWIEDEQVSAIYLTSWKSITGISLIALREDSNVVVTTSAPVLPWTVETRKDAVFTHSNSTSPENITLVEAGAYLVTCQFSLDFSGAALVDYWIELDTVEVTGTRRRIRGDASAAEATATLTAVIIATANQVLRLKFDSSSGSHTSDLNRNSLVIQRI